MWKEGYYLAIVHRWLPRLLNRQSGASEGYSIQQLHNGRRLGDVGQLDQGR
jgi:hypothetical protein